MGSKPVQSVPIHARVPKPDVALIDKAAKENLITRSAMVARVVREWAKTQGKRVRK